MNLFIAQMIRSWQSVVTTPQISMFTGILSQNLSNLLVIYRDSLVDRPLSPYDIEHYTKTSEIARGIPGLHGVLLDVFKNYFEVIEKISKNTVTLHEKGEALRNFYIEDDLSPMTPLEPCQFSREFSFEVKSTADWDNIDTFHWHTPSGME
jgi:hypothetical protein